eukprot:CAMPEP_0117046368 /NCGR_PEP_ID=MMETSP0472-20121206/32059_1 /TAXON_ID=693140 ORGANISM="Tiarina fusus, Strain LIS" /NCGR_SAMPLE_ID=MMETSP0472 /ASSEMBLY_ACC=CAM_ASM_000603 /LENGTH=124 /DNA_ID=CAMNT_0004758689 /DNA_START=84 /DNA_END=458 /DNA_ORIENTATION=-
MPASIESDLVRQLDIRFIDARTIVNEAKVNLGFHGYVADNGDVHKIHEEARRIFMDRPLGARQTMRRLSSNLEAVKSTGANSCGGSVAFSDVGSSCGDGSFDTTSSSSKRSNRLWGFGRRQQQA